MSPEDTLLLLKERRSKLEQELQDTNSKIDQIERHLKHPVPPVWGADEGPGQ